MFLVISFLSTVFFLLGTFFLTALASSLRRIQRRDSRKQFIAAGNRFFYRPFHLYFFPKHEYEGLFFATICAQNLTRCCYIVSAVLFLMATPLFESPSLEVEYNQFNIFWIILSSVAFFLISFILGDYIPRLLGMRFSEKMLQFCAPLSSVFMFLAFPITFLFLKISQSFSNALYFDPVHEPEAQAKQEIIEIIEDAELSPGINKHDKTLFESVLLFRERIAREVMVPRVNVFGLPAQTSIKEAASLLAAEGYSRVPIYRSTIDEITGVLMYKDILAKFRQYEERGNDASILEAPIETIQKNVLYTPETKHISNLLQEFRKKQVHFAIVVDEYGGTEGIVTIEDILEEIVGEIADEYDDEQSLVTKQPDGSWILDAHMNILDAEDALGISIPQEGEYDTLGGYVFHCAGAIPSNGFVVHQDAFDLEVIESNERVVEKVRIKPVRDSKSNSDHSFQDDNETH